MTTAPTAQVIPISDAQQAQLTERALTWPERAAALKVTSDAEYAAAGSLLRDIKALLGEISDTFDPIVKSAHAAHKVAVEKRSTAQAPLADAELVIKRRMGDYVVEQQRRQREEQARLEAEAKRAEEEARLAEAQALADAGEPELADKVLAEPFIAPTVVARAAVPRIAGVAPREVWSATVDDKLKLVQAVAAGHVPLGVLEVNMTVLNQMARSLKSELAYPGVKVNRGNTMTARGR